MWGFQLKMLCFWLAQLLQYCLCSDTFLIMPTNNLLAQTGELPWL
jgi:hypothetical protein